MSDKVFYTLSAIATVVLMGALGYVIYIAVEIGKIMCVVLG